MKEIIPPTHPIFQALIEIQKPRSRFQLEYFVAGQHDTEEQQYRQVLLEIQQLVFTLKKFYLELDKTNIQIQRLIDTGDEIDAIDAKIKEIDREQSELVVVGAERELKDLLEMWEAYEHKYTYEELEANQMVYWDARLTRQAQLEALGSNGKIGWSSLDALRQIGKLDTTTIEQETETTKELQ